VVRAAYGRVVLPRPSAPVAVAGGLTVMAVAQCVGQERGAAATATALMGTAAVGLGARRAEAVMVLAAVSVVGQSLWRPGDPVFGSFLALMAAFYLLARHRTWRAVAGGAAVTAAALLVLLLRDPRPFVPVELVFPLAYFGAATTAGRLVRGRDQHAQALLGAAAREAAARERATVAEERARIARDMHDVVAHSVSLLVVQAESAAAVLPHDPVRAAAQVERAADSGRQALDELRRVLGVLRAPAASDVVAQPGLPDLHALAGAVRDTGRAVRLEVEPGLEDVPVGLQLSAYRVVQEALTNACRHGAAQQIDICVERRGDQLAVEVVDDGAGGAAAADGHGIAGMRERMRAYHGQVEAGPRPGGGWRVRATAPLEPA
jgi:signal transduction histidine kinase